MDKIEEINHWLQEGSPYEKGVALFQRYSHNLTLMRVLPGRPERYREKLEYELRKLAGLTQPEKKLVPSSMPSPDSHQYHFSELEELLPEGNASEQDTPKAIQGLRDEFSRCYKRRSILHRELRQTSPENTAEKVARRKVLADQIKALSARMDELWPIYEAWRNEGVCPKEENSFDKALPGESPRELKAKIDNLKKTISKDKLFLQYQSVKKQPSPNPLPHGPRRHELEERIRAKQAEMDELKNRLNGLTQD